MTKSSPPPVLPSSSPVEWPPGGSPPDRLLHLRTIAQRLAATAGAAGSQRLGGSCSAHGQMGQTTAIPLRLSLWLSLHRRSTWVPDISIISEREREIVYVTAWIQIHYKHLTVHHLAISWYTSPVECCEILRKSNETSDEAECSPDWRDAQVWKLEWNDMTTRWSGSRSYTNVSWAAHCELFILVANSTANLGRTCSTADT